MPQRSLQLIDVSSHFFTNAEPNQVGWRMLINKNMNLKIFRVILRRARTSSEMMLGSFSNALSFGKKEHDMKYYYLQVNQNRLHISKLYRFLLL